MKEFSVTFKITCESDSVIICTYEFIVIATKFTLRFIINFTGPQT